MRRITLWSVILLLVARSTCQADGVFVFRWNKQIDINEPTQKAIILHDQGREDLVLQVKYEGPAEEFGWLIPVPSIPEVSQGSMESFYELSRATQRKFPMGEMMLSKTQMFSDNFLSSHAEVRVLKTETVGAYEVTILTAATTAKLAEWLDANSFSFPKEKQNVLDDYIKKNWCFVAVKIDPKRSGFVVQHGMQKTAPKKAIPESTREKLANGELNPLKLSFDSAKCVFPLAISSVNGKPSEVSLYVVSAEPLMSPVIFQKKFAAYGRERADWIGKAAERKQQRDESMEKLQSIQDNQTRPEGFRGRQQALSNDPADPRPSIGSMREMAGADRRWRDESEYPGRERLVLSMEIVAKDLTNCVKELPRLVGKSWWLTKQVQTFEPSEMRDLEFEPALPILADKLSTPDGNGIAMCLPQFGERGVTLLLEGVKSSDFHERSFSLAALMNLADPRIKAVVPNLLTDADAIIRRNACYAAGANWDGSFTSRLNELLNDTDGQVREAAGFILRQHPDASQFPLYQKMVAADGAAAAQAIGLLHTQDLTREKRIKLFSSTNLPVVSTAFTPIRYTLTLSETEPLLNNPLPMVRLMGLGELYRMRDKAAIDRMVAMLPDPNSNVAWMVRSRLRMLTGQTLGADGAAYAKWWRENRETFVMPPAPPDRRSRQQPGF